jgi:Flp pilus assembly protein TadG
MNPFCSKQRGASAVEFAFVFPVLFLLVYGVIVYSYVYVLQQSITFAAQHSAESVASVDPSPQASFDSRVRERVRQVAVEQLRWLPASQRDRVLGDNGEKLGIEFVEVEGSSVVRVRVSFDLDGLFPSIALPLIGNIPPLPAQLQAQASART